MGRTPMHSAAERGQLDVVRLLGAHGVDLNAKDKQGRTPHAAAANDDIRAMLDRVAASQQDEGAKAALTAEADAAAALDGEARHMQEAEERRLEAEAQAAAKAEADARVAELDAQRRQRAASRGSGGASNEGAAAPAGPVSPSITPRGDGIAPSSPNGDAAHAASPPATPSGGLEDDDEEDDEPTPASRARAQIPTADKMEQLRGAAAALAKAKADAWRQSREAAKSAEEAKAAAKAEEAKRLVKAQSETSKAREEELKRRQQEEAAAKAAAIAALMAKMNESEIAGPEAAEGSLSYEALKAMPDKEAMRTAGVLSQKREWYMPTAEFATVMGMAKPEFYAMPQWKRDKLKKEKGLF